MTERTYLSLWHGRKPWPMTMHEIAEHVAAETGIAVGEIRGWDLSQAGCEARQRFAATAYATGRFSLTQLGAFLDRRHHSTVLYSIRAHEERSRGRFDACGHHPHQIKVAP